MPDTTDSTPAAERDWAATELALLLIMESVPSGSEEFYGRPMGMWWASRLTRRSRGDWIAILRTVMRDPKGFLTSNVGLVLEKLGLPADWRTYRHLVNAGRKRQRPRSSPITEQEVRHD